MDVPNTRFCADKGERGAVCEYVNGGPTERYDKPEWDEMRFGMACTDVESLTELLGVIKKLCFESGRCTYKDVQKMDASFKRIMKSLDLKASREKKSLAL